MSTEPAPGLTANWLNGWLAALGAALLVPDLRLTWSADREPHAVFEHPTLGRDRIDVAELIASRLPTRDALQRLAIAKTHPGHPGELPRKVTAAAYRDRAALARQTGDPTLGWTVTDLARANQDQSLPASPFYPAGPGTVGTLHDRLMACHDPIGVDLAGSVRRSLAGTASRVKRFGLGFDYRRITSPTDPNGDNWIDPAVEVLAFFGLAFHPVRGSGRSTRAATRGWTKAASSRGAYTWPAWDVPLDAPSIDALLDQFWDWAGDAQTKLGRESSTSVARVHGRRPPPPVVAAYQIVPFKRLGPADPTRGYGSERIA